MSRITGSDAKALMEAYAAVYAPQELTEEQIWEEVEAWVNSLVEEGYDLSEYTWEDMYEDYLNEASAQGGRVTGSNPTVFKAAERPAGTRRGAAAGTRRTTSSSPAPAPAPKPSTPSPTPSARPSAAPTPRPAAAPTPTQSKVSPTQASSPKPGTQAAGPASIKPKTPNPLLKGGEISGMIKRSQERQAATPKPAAPANRATGSKKPGSAFESYDAYDLVLEYLLDNGHVDTVDEAHYVMLEMKAEVIQGIVEARAMAHTGGKPHPLQGAGGRPKGITGGTTYKMKGWDDDNKKPDKGV